MAGELDVIQNYLDRRAAMAQPAQGLLAPAPAPPVAPAFTPPFPVTPPPYVARAPALPIPPIPPPQYGPPAAAAPRVSLLSQAAMNSAIAHLAGERAGAGQSTPTFRGIERRPDDFAPPTTPSTPPRATEGVDASFLRLPDYGYGIPGL